MFIIYLEMLRIKKMFSITVLLWISQFTNAIQSNKETKTPLFKEIRGANIVDKDYTIQVTAKVDVKEAKSFVLVTDSSNNVRVKENIVPISVVQDSQKILEKEDIPIFSTFVHSQTIQMKDRAPLTEVQDSQKIIMKKNKPHFSTLVHSQTIQMKEDRTPLTEVQDSHRIMMKEDRIPIQSKVDDIQITQTRKGRPLFSTIESSKNIRMKEDIIFLSDIDHSKNTTVKDEKVLVTDFNSDKERDGEIIKEPLDNTNDIVLNRLARDTKLEINNTSRAAQHYTTESTLKRLLSTASDHKPKSIVAIVAKIDKITKLPTRLYPRISTKKIDGLHGKRTSLPSVSPVYEIKNLLKNDSGLMEPVKLVVSPVPRNFKPPTPNPSGQMIFISIICVFKMINIRHI